MIHLESRRINETGLFDSIVGIRMSENVVRKFKGPWFVLRGD